MIQIEKIWVREFRGIRDLSLDLRSKSFVVWGPNGSGKSGVVDAIEFALSGTITRLTGEGSAGLTVARHGPHVHRRDDPQSAQVSLEVRETRTGKTAVLTRNVKTPKSYTLEPDVPVVREAIDRAAQHPELSLSRREIIKYVAAEAGKRSREVQALLKLDRVGDTRALLRSVQTKLKTTQKSASDQFEEAKSALGRHFDSRDLVLSEMLTAVNRRRATLGLADIDELVGTTSLDEGIQRTEPHAFNRDSAIRDVDALAFSISSIHEGELEGLAQLLAGLAAIDSDPRLLNQINREDFINRGLSYVADHVCPLCGHEWHTMEELRNKIELKLAASRDAKDVKRRIDSGAAQLRTQIGSLRSLLGAVEPLASSSGVELLKEGIKAWSDDLLQFQTEVSSLDGAFRVRDRLAHEPMRIPEGFVEALASLRRVLSEIPDQSATVSAQTFLAVAQERLTVFRRKRDDLKRAQSALEIGQTLYESYCDAAESALASLYRTVETDFGSFYREINSEDEAAFKAELGHSEGKLDLKVDFYGLGMFPPLAYHSEGHQDGMGVCLYLALVKQLLGADFRFAVLDDVVMSVDSSHRRKFCALLKEKFPDTQFVITTHDQVWARQMQSTGLISSKAQAKFDGWTVDDGPYVAQSADFWDEIDADLIRNDVPSAAQRLRRSLEAITSDLADGLGAKVAYRGDGSYDFGELFGAVNGRHRDLLNEAGKSAEAWKNAEAQQLVKKLKAERSAAISIQQDENWLINKAVHNNDWASLSKADFAPVVAGMKAYLRLFTCSSDGCEGWLYVMPRKGKPESLRCPCASFSLNLRAK